MIQNYITIQFNVCNIIKANLILHHLEIYLYAGVTFVFLTCAILESEKKNATQIVKKCTSNNKKNKYKYVLTVVEMHPENLTCLVFISRKLQVLLLQVFSAILQLKGYYQQQLQQQHYFEILYQILQIEIEKFHYPSAATGSISCIFKS